jgi:hypothetical protein
MPNDEKKPAAAAPPAPSAPARSTFASRAAARAKAAQRVSGKAVGPAAAEDKSLDSGETKTTRRT